ncbi:MAG: hypothetical protein HZA13_00385 [Nitrospirae bacterium]|nr:hypothetical protein [Nitrospirota bacterium]
MFRIIKDKFFPAGIILIFIISGCASIEHKIDQLPLGATTVEVSDALKEERYTVIEHKSGPDGVVDVRRYSFYFDLRKWDLTFKDDKLISWKPAETGPDYSKQYNESEGIGYPCEDPLLGIAIACIFFSCDD